LNILTSNEPLWEFIQSKINSIAPESSSPVPSPVPSPKPSPPVAKLSSTPQPASSPRGSVLKIDDISADIKVLSKEQPKVATAKAPTPKVEPKQQVVQTPATIPEPVSSPVQETPATRPPRESNADLYGTFQDHIGD
jgi:hypothetical protein